MFTLKLNAFALMAMSAVTTLAGAPHAENVNSDNRIRLSVDVSPTELWIGELFQIEICLAIDLPHGTRASLEPLSPDHPPHLIVPFLMQDTPPGIKGPDVHALLKPMLTMDTSLPALKINDYAVTTGTRSWDVRLLESSDASTRPARFSPNRQWRLDNGKRWIEYTLRSQWQAVAEGVYAFGPVSFSGQVAVAMDAGERIRRWRHVSVTSGVAMVTVASPPRDRYPENFFGAIGSAMPADVIIEPQTCRVGDPLKLILRIGGDVSSDRLYPPRLQMYDTVNTLFRVHDDSARTVRADDGTEFHYVIRPVTEGAIEFPALKLPWYDRAGQYFTYTTTQPLPLQVLPAARIESRHASFIPAAFRDDADGWKRVSWRDERNSLRLAALGPALYLLIIALAALPCQWRSLRRWRRRHTAARSLRRRLRRLTPEIAITHMIIARAVRAAYNRFFADILDFDVYTKTPDELWQTIADRCPRAMPSPEARDIMERCYHQCFTEQPAVPFDPATDIRRLAQALSALPVNLFPKKMTSSRNPAKRRPPMVRRAFAPLIAGMIVVALLLVPRTDTPPRGNCHTRRHIWKEANALASHAQTQADYAAARERYRELLAAGAHHAALYYNYGTSCLKTADIETAIAALRRAATMEGLSRDLRHNLDLAWRQHTAAADRMTVTDRIQRAGFQLLFRTGAAGRLRMAAFAMLAVWLALSIRYLYTLKRILNRHA